MTPEALAAQRERDRQDPRGGHRPTIAIVKERVCHDAVACEDVDPAPASPVTADERREGEDVLSADTTAWTGAWTRALRPRGRTGGG